VQEIVESKSQDEERPVEEIQISEAQKIPETRFSKRVQEQMMRSVNEQQLSPVKKRPLEG
jgi:hypothetical protein